VVLLRHNELWPIYLYEAHHRFPMAGTVKETVMPVREEAKEDIKTLLEGTDVAWAQYKRGQGTQVTNIKELDTFLDSL
jgi:hypothetical protein